jgi:hypothetical protein
MLQYGVVGVRWGSGYATYGAVETLSATIEASVQEWIDQSPRLFAGHFHWSFTMSKLTTETITKIANEYNAFVDAGASYGALMQSAAKKLGGTPCPTLLEALAKVHASKYKCNYTWDAAGSAVFHTGAESTRETRQDAARQSWRRNVMVWFKSESAAKPVSHARISKQHREAAMDFLSMFEGKDLEAQVRAARALLAQLTK